MDYKEFYSELGKLLYAIADADQMISKQEKRRLLDIVKNELAPKESRSDEFETNDAFYAEFEFEYLDEQVIDSVTAFESFINFIEDHYTAFDSDLKKLCQRLPEEIAASYRGTSQKEQKLITELNKKMKALENKKTYTPKLEVKEGPDI